MRAVRSLTDQILRSGISGSWKGLIVLSPLGFSQGWVSSRR
jgi:hypothetical protein